MSNETVTQYTIKQVLDIAKDGGYKFCCLEDVNGGRKTNWNGYNVKIVKHLEDCIKRFNSKGLPEGFYYFCFTDSHRNVNNCDRFLVAKGNANKPVILNNNLQQNQNTFSPNSILSVEKALSYITEISDLKVKLQVTEAENKTLKERNEVLEAYFDAEDSEDNLSEGKPSDTLTYLKETAPSLMSLADRWFEDRDKQREVELAKIKAGIGVQKKRIIKGFEVGSDAHLNLIRSYFKNSNEDAMNKELNKLEAKDIDKYNAICEELNLNENEEDEDNDN